MLAEVDLMHGRSLRAMVESDGRWAGWLRTSGGLFNDWNAAAMYFASRSLKLAILSRRVDAGLRTRGAVFLRCICDAKGRWRWMRGAGDL